MTPELKTYVLQIAGVTSFLGINKEHKEPIPLSQEEVDRLLGITDPNRDVKVYSYMPGDMVKVSSVLTDFEGIVQKTTENEPN